MPFKPLPITNDVAEDGFKSLPLEDTGAFKPIQIKSPTPKVEQEVPYMAQHPNLYAAKETAKDLAKDILPYVKYFDPKEREDFMKLDKQHQVRALLKENLFSQLFMFPGSKGFKYGMGKATGWFAKNFPKTAKALTKPRMVSKLQREEAIIESAKQTPAVKNVIAALKEAKPLRKEQEAIYTKVRGERLAKLKKVGSEIDGEKGYHAKLSELKGEMPKVQFESIRNKIGQEEVDSLFNQIGKSELNEWDKLPASKGLSKLFGEYGGTVPTENEIAKLSEVFGKEFVKTAMEKRTMFSKLKNVGLQVANLPRAFRASMDFSAPLRQGVFLIGRPKAFFSSFLRQFKPFFSERSYQSLTREIFSRPTAGLMKENGLAITHLGESLAGREEIFMSNLAEKIPLVGRGVRASERAYVGFLNKLRADVFDDFVKKGVRWGIEDPKFLKDAANYINTATGRGGLGPLEPAAVQLNSWFFSPRLMASRLNLINPAYYATLQPQVRKEAIKDLFLFGSTAFGVASLAKAAGADIVLDPRNSDFMKVKFGNTRYDILGGFQQPIRLVAQLISGKIISSTTGKTMVLGEGFRGLTRTEIISRYLEYKEAPTISFATGLIRGKTALGEKFDLPTEIANLFVPMVTQDIYDLYKEKGFEGIPMASPAMFGVGVQSYGGVQSFGLNGKDYPKLNNELLRLKTSMGYPSSVAFGEELTVKEYKRLKAKTGVEVANFLNKLIETPSYKTKNDIKKLKMVEHKIDLLKDRVKKKMFPMKRRKGDIKSRLKSMRGLSDEEASKQADEILKRKKYVE